MPEVRPVKVALNNTLQRSTQYDNMAEILSAPELLSSPLSTFITAVTTTTLAGQAYLLATLDETSPNFPTLPAIIPILSRLGATSEIYQYFEALADVQGPLLRPLEPQFTPFVPLEIAEIRRYKGKTDEIFTLVMRNI